MKLLPETEFAAVVRTDWSDQSAWEETCAAILEPVDDFQANVTFIERKEYSGATIDQLLDLVPEDYGFSFLMVIDKKTISDEEHPVLIIDLLEEPGREFRAIPVQIQAVENNLSVANMGFAEFADLADENGVFRGLPEE